MKNQTIFEIDYATLVPDYSPYKAFVEVMDVITKVNAAANMNLKSSEKSKEILEKEELKNAAEILRKRRIEIIRKLESDYWDEYHNVESWISHKPIRFKNPVAEKECIAYLPGGRPALFIFLSIEKTINQRKKIYLCDLKELERYIGRECPIVENLYEIYSDLEAEKSF